MRIMGMLYSRQPTGRLPPCWSLRELPTLRFLGDASLFTNDWISVEHGRPKVRLVAFLIGEGSRRQAGNLCSHQRPFDLLTLFLLSVAPQRLG